MWASWSEKASKSMADASKSMAEATKGISEVMEKTGGALSQAAVNAKQKATNPTSTTEGTIVALPPKDSEVADEKKSGTDGDNVASAEAGEGAKKGCSEQGEKGDKSGTTSPARVAPSASAAANANKEKLLKNFQMGWSTMVQTTKRSIDATVQIIEKEQNQFKQNFPFPHLPGGKGKFYKRDPNAPLDVEALRDAEVVYVTDRIITMGHPAMASNTRPQFISAERKLAAIGQLLQQRHDGRFLVWNLSEVEYDISILDDQVLTFSFPGSPAPPLGLLLKLLVSMENWLSADDRNVAVIHCLTGRGRTSSVLAAFLCWMGQAGFSNDIPQALAYIARCKQMKPDELTIPSQRRYGSYFSSMLDNVKPSQQPLLLKRIIMSEAPKFAKGPPREDMEMSDPTPSEDGEPPKDITPNEEKLMGCAPYLQIFKAGKLIFTTAATIHYQQSEQDLPFIQGVDGPVPFNVEEVIQGDILIRCRHLTFNKERVSMFRAAFHTGYVPQNVLRLTKTQLDGACSDKRFSDDFFLDLIFERVDQDSASANDEQGDNEEEKSKSDEKKKEPKGAVVTATSYDSMLHGDSRFWDVIAERRKESAKSNIPLWGPTVGHRRSDRKKKATEDDAAIGDGKKAAEVSPAERTQLETFSIGGELDFLPKEAPAPKETKLPEKDSLMEALMALDQDDSPPAKTDTEQVVFSGQSDKPNEPVFPDSSHSSEPDSKTASKEALPDSATSTLTSDAEASGSKKESESTEAAQPVAEEDDMDALLALSEDEDFGDVDLADFEDDDDLEDLEKMLQT